MSSSRWWRSGVIAAALSACGPNSARVEHEEDGSGLPLPWVQRAQTVSGPLAIMSMMQMALDGGSFTTGDAGDLTTDAGNSAGDDAGTSTTDAGGSTTTDAGTSSATDAGTSTTSDAGISTVADAGTSTAGDAGTNGGSDAGTSTASDAGTNGGSDAGTSTANDAGTSAGNDAGTSSASDAGTIIVSDAGAGTSGDAGAGTNAASDAGTSMAGDAGAEHAGPRGAEISPHLALGIPDTSSVGSSTKWLLVRPQLATSYDTTRKVPNWTAWTLDVTNFGPATRATTFRIDPLLPTGTPQGRDSDYTGSGFDRGHLCPSADRTSTDADNDATFFLTNVVPQTHASNAGPWLDLEDEARTLANQGKRLVIIAGPIFGATTQTIGTGVHVPVSMFKVVVVLEGVPAPAAVTTSTLVYATIIPNSSVVSGAWRQWQVTIDDVEAQTGLDFLSDVDPAIQAAVERTRAP